MLAQAGDVARNGVLRHLSRLVQSPPVSDATRQLGNESGVAALRFRSEHDVVLVSGLGHETDGIVLGKPGQTNVGTDGIVVSKVWSSFLAILHF